MLLEVRGLAFDVTAGGPPDGRPVVLLHGFPLNRHCWSQVTSLLHAAGLRTYAVDQRGYSPGARPDGVDAYRLAECVADALAFVDTLAGGRADVVGHDFGALVGWQLAIDHPSAVRTLTTVSVPHPAAFGHALLTDPEQQRRSSYFTLFRTAGKAEHVLTRDGGAALRTMLAGAGASRVDVYAAPLLAPGALTATLNWYRAMSVADLASASPVTVPTTYVWGDRDVAVAPTTAEASAAHVTADYRSVPLAGVDHWIPDTDPGPLADAILARLATTDPGRDRTARPVSDRGSLPAVVDPGVPPAAGGTLPAAGGGAGLPSGVDPDRPVVADGGAHPVAGHAAGPGTGSGVDGGADLGRRGAGGDTDEESAGS